MVAGACSIRCARVEAVTTTSSTSATGTSCAWAVVAQPPIADSRARVLAAPVFKLVIPCLDQEEWRIVIITRSCKQIDRGALAQPGQAAARRDFRLTPAGAGQEISRRAASAGWASPDPKPARPARFR